MITEASQLTHVSPATNFHKTFPEQGNLQICVRDRKAPKIISAYMHNDEWFWQEAAYLMQAIQPCWSRPLSCRADMGPMVR